MPRPPWLTLPLAPCPSWSPPRSPFRTFLSLSMGCRLPMVVVDDELFPAAIVIPLTTGLSFGSLLPPRQVCVDQIKHASQGAGINGWGGRRCQSGVGARQVGPAGGALHLGQGGPGRLLLWYVQVADRMVPFRWLILHRRPGLGGILLLLYLSLTALLPAQTWRRRPGEAGAERDPGSLSLSHQGTRGTRLCHLGGRSVATLSWPPPPSRAMMIEKSVMYQKNQKKKKKTP